MGTKKELFGEEYINVIQDMYDGCTASVRTLLGSTERFEVKVGLHQGSALRDHIRNEDITKAATVQPITTYLLSDTEETTLVWTRET